MTDSIKRLKELVDSSDNIVFFGGAGVSTESGIPDFRSTGGLYHQEWKYPPEVILSHTFYDSNPDEFFRFYRAKLLAPDAKPNAAHKKLAEWEAEGRLKAVITQNIDGLHQAAGSRNVLELHGSVHRNHCQRCGKFYGLEHILRTEGVPRCSCGGIIKPDVVLYEEGLDQGTLEAAVRALAEADMLMIGGTSLNVYPAAGLIRYYQGHRLVLLNKSPVARTLDVALILHADNGGGNNSTFTNHVVTSSGTDTYSAIAASMASLKGPRHGGANSKVMAMMDDVKEHVRDWNDEGCVADYLTRILNKDAFDRSGLIYGLGHAVYTKTDPRCEVFRAYVNHLAAEKGREDELALYANVEKIGKQLLMERQHKSVLSTNIDFYSGFVYEMLGLPKELYTPLFAVARIAGWSAHRMEELSVGGKLIRPRYECVEEHRPYTSMDRR